MTAAAWAVLILLALMAVAQPAQAQFRTRNVVLDEDSSAITAMVSGDAMMLGVYQDSFWRGDADGREVYYLGVALHLQLDLQFTSNSQALVSVRTPRRTTGNDFGDDPPINAPGILVPNGEIGLELDEAAVLFSGVLTEELRLRAGVFHTMYGLNTAVKDTGQRANWWDGHGSMWLDTRTARDFDIFEDTGDADLRPTGAELIWDDRAEYRASATWVWLHLDPENPETEVRLLAFTGEYFNQSNQFRLGGGYSVWFEADQEDVETLFSYVWIPFDFELTGFGEIAWQFGGATGTAWYLGSRYQFSDINGFLEMTYWSIAGDDGGGTTDDGFRGHGSIHSTLIINSLDYGLGRQRNYRAQIIAAGMELSYGLDLVGVVAFFEAIHEAESPDPGNEVDVSLVYRVGTLRLSATAAYLYDSHAIDNISEAMMFLFMTSMTF